MSHKTRNPYFQPASAGPDMSIMRVVMRTPSLFLLMALVMQIVTMPFKGNPIVTTTLQIVVSLSAIGVAAGNRRHMYIGLGLAILSSRSRSRGRRC